MTEYTFHNVTITIEASSAGAAYAVLCQRIGDIPDAEFMTDTYRAEGTTDDIDTSTLFNRG